MKRVIVRLLLFVGVMSACRHHTSPAPSAVPPVVVGSRPAPEVATAAQPQRPELGEFGLQLEYRDPSIKAGDDFFAYANGAWLKSYKLKADEVRFGSFIKLHYRSEDRVKAIIDDLIKQRSAPGTDAQRISDYFKSYMDLSTLNQKGIAPLVPELVRIAAINSRLALVRALGEANRTDTATPIAFFVGIDRQNPDRHMLNLIHAGLGLPDRSYYLEDTKRFVEVRKAYVDHIAQLLAFAPAYDKPRAARAAKAILALETAIAKHHWPRAKLRDRDKTQNRFSADKLLKSYRGFAWAEYFKAAQIDIATLKDLNIYTPDALAPLARLVKTQPLAVWKDYLSYHLIKTHAELLGEAIDKAHFDFYGKILDGQPQRRDRWKRAVMLIGAMHGLGEAIGRIYVERHFPQSAKAKMDALVGNLRAALDARIKALPWMGEATKQQALKKLETFNPKIGYPAKWRDFSSLKIAAGDLLGNYRAVSDYWYAVALERLGKPTDRLEWFMTPQMVNAYYNAAFNEIVFPAAILQPPFFDPHADDAVNYGAIGAVIGHELGHGFDDQGSKSDYAGRQRNWWTDVDRKNFEKLTARLVDQYKQYQPLEGHFIDGKLTLGENIGDLGGLSMAYHAYKLSLDGKTPPVIDGLSGDQRFFLSWAQVWRSKMRDALLLRKLKTDPHSPARFRVNGVVRNIDAWYAAFDVKPGDALYLEPKQRVTIW